MKISYNWLRELVPVKATPESLAERLTMAGLEATSMEAFGGDTIIELEITANRPDWLSMRGIAQELSAIFGKPMRTRRAQPKTKKKKSGPRLARGYVSIRDKKACAFYRGCLITGVKVGPSPEWLSKRLESLGIRPVNNVVDITNYCLLEYGQPLHAFNFDAIDGRIIVRKAERGEKILTIDAVERTLASEALVISDTKRAIAIAGIMGGKQSEVGSQTKAIFLESAYFDPVVVRRASRKLGLSSDSSYRFERGVDFEGVRLAQDAAVRMICEITGGELADEKAAGEEISVAPRRINFSCREARKVLSLNVADGEIKRVFTNLGISAKKAAAGTLAVNIPARRRDIKRQEDLVEELARIRGYDKIPSTLPAIRSQQIQNSSAEQLKPSARRLLCSLGFYEVITYSLVSQQLLDSIGCNQAAKLANPLSNEQEFLRPTLCASLIQCLSYNLNHRNTNARLFEISHVFGSDYKEEMSAAFIVTGRALDSWQLKKGFDFFCVKGALLSLISRLGFDDLTIREPGASSIFGSEQAEVVCQDKVIARFGKIKRDVLLRFDIKNAPDCFYAEISLSGLSRLELKQKRFQPLSVYPSVTRDLSLVAKQSVSYQEIAEAVQQEAGSYLCSIVLVDTYRGEHIPKGSRGLTISLELGCQNHTLAEEEVALIHASIVKRLKSELAIELR